MGQAQHLGATAPRDMPATPAKSVPGAVHHLPCSVKHRGDANVSVFFTPTLERAKDDSKGSADVHQAQFRGLAMRGESVVLAKGSKGYVIESQGDCQSAVESAAKPLRVLGAFSEFTVWDYADNVKGQDQYRAAVHDWNRMSRLIHEPVPVQSTPGAVESVSV